MRAGARGYTLIEILAVLVIVGIVIALARVQFARSPAQTLADEARQLALVLELARDEAMTRGCTLAWTARGDAHRLECRRGQAAAAADDGLYAKRPWHGPVELERVLIAGVPVSRDSSLLFTPSGINAPFELVLAMDGNRVQVAGDFLGRVSVASLQR
jgi:general secretion pathway protein H